MSKKALLTGITGQDGAYLAEFLLAKGYEVHGLKRRASSLNTERIDHLYRDPHDETTRLFLYYGDLTDSTNLIRVVEQVRPDEIYNLGGQSHVAVSFETPEYTADAVGLGALRVLEAIRALGLTKTTRFYQASSSELFGKAQQMPQDERTPFYPRSPYAVSKLFAYWITVNYREAYDMFACNGILFNHESPLRGETFVTRKISRGLTRIVCGLQDRIYVGNLEARRDWGHARDYVRAQWLMLQQPEPDDYVIATGVQHSVREFVDMACHFAGLEIEWRGEGAQQVGIATKGLPPSRLAKDPIIVSVDPAYYRPTEVDALQGNATRACHVLGWEPEISFPEMVSEMIQEDLKRARKEALAKSHGYERGVGGTQK